MVMLPCRRTDVLTHSIHGHMSHALAVMALLTLTVNPIGPMHLSHCSGLFGFMSMPYLLSFTHPHDERHSGVDAGAVSPPLPQSVTASPCSTPTVPAGTQHEPQRHEEWRWRPTKRRRGRLQGMGQGETGTGEMRKRSGGGGGGWAAPKVWKQGHKRGGWVGLPPHVIHSQVRLMLAVRAWACLPVRIPPHTLLDAPFRLL